MRGASIGDTVKIDCVMKVEGELIYDSRAANKPLHFTVGEGQVVEGIERAVVGMEAGEWKSTSVEEAYGPYREDLRWRVDRETVESPARKVGARVHVRLPDQVVVATITQIGDETMTLDANHPLAGRAIDFDIQLLGRAGRSAAKTPSREEERTDGAHP